MTWIQFIAKITQPNFKAIAKKSGVPQLVTIPYSHYVELARWSLQLQGVQFKEICYAPGQHMLPLIATRLGNGNHLSKSSFVEKVRTNDELSKFSPKPASAAKIGNEARSTAVPVLVMPDQRVLTDSWEIATIGAGFAPLPEDRHQFYDKELGPSARHWAYSHILKPQNRNILNALCTVNTGFLWPIIWWIAQSYVYKLMCKIFQPFNAQTNKECRDKLHIILAKTDEIVRNKKGQYINGDEITLDDVALCSLGAILVFPSTYAAGLYSKYFDILSAQDPEYAAERNQLMGTLTGQYIMNFYQENRGRVVQKQ